MTSTIKADVVTASTTNADLSLDGNGTGVADLGVGYKVGGTVDPLSGVAPGTSGNLLTSNGSAWTSAAAAGGGKILQVVTANLATYATHASTNVDNPAEILTASITPGAASSKVLVFGHVSGSSTNTSVQYVGTILKRDTTIIGNGDNAAWNAGTGESHANMMLPSYSKSTTWPFNFVDSPSSTSALTYKIFAFANHFTSSLQVSTFVQNGGGYSYNNKEASMGTTSLTLMEIGV